MVKSLAILGFIGATAAGAAVLATRPTVIDGKVMAADLLGMMQKRGISAVECDERIPIQQRGAVFQCTVRGDDGSTARVEYTMSRSSNLTARILDTTGPTTEAHEKVPPSADPWAN